MNYYEVLRTDAMKYELKVAKKQPEHFNGLPHKVFVYMPQLFQVNREISTLFKVRLSS